MCVWVRVHIPLIPLIPIAYIVQRGWQIWSLMPDEGVTEGVSDLIPYEDKQWSNVREGANVFNYVQFTSVPCVAAIPIWVILLLQILVLVQINIQCGYGSKSKTQQAKEPNTYLFIFVYMNSPFPHFSYVDLFGGVLKAHVYDPCKRGTGWDPWTCYRRDYI